MTFVVLRDNVTNISDDYVKMVFPFIVWRKFIKLALDVVSCVVSNARC